MQISGSALYFRILSSLLTIKFAADSFLTWYASIGFFDILLEAMLRSFFIYSVSENVIGRILWMVQFITFLPIRKVPGMAIHN